MDFGFALREFSVVGLSGCTAHANLTLADGLWTEVKPAASQR